MPVVPGTFGLLGVLRGCWVSGLCVWIIGEGLLANLATSILVGVGSNLGLPMLTTHVSTGAIAGIVGSKTERLNRRTMRALALAWTVTPLVAGLIAGMSYLIAVRMTS